MSRLYLIEDRLYRFFKKHPIKVSGPDKSVAQDAAIYHYYRHQNDALYQQHRTLLNNPQTEQNENKALFHEVSPTPLPSTGIRSISQVQNESL